MKARASIDGADSFTWFAGDVTALEPGGKSTPLFGLEGYNVSRAIEVKGGYDLLTREAVFYLDSRSRQIIDKFDNPWTESTVDVLHIWNDPVNMRFREQMPWGPFRVPVFEMGDDVLFKMDVFLAYPSPLARAEFPDNSQDDTYQAVEMFGFATTRSALESDSPSAPTRVSWTRIAPWLPWMGNGDRPGQLVYHCEGVKVGGFDDMPEQIRARVLADAPHFTSAPTEWSEPNETSWTYFKKVVAGRVPFVPSPDQ